MTHLEIKRGHHICTPADKTLVLEELLATPHDPYLFTQCSRNLGLHCNTLLIVLNFKFCLTTNDFVTRINLWTMVRANGRLRPRPDWTSTHVTKRARISLARKLGPVKDTVNTPARQTRQFLDTLG
jgi:hypothetical protein